MGGNMCSAMKLHRVLRENGYDECSLESIRYFSRSRTNLSTFLHFILSTHKNCSSDIVKLLLKFGADVNAEHQCRFPLQIALENSRDDAVVMTLLEKGANVNPKILARPRDYCGLRFCRFMPSPLCLALQRASENVIRTLLDAGCSLDACKDEDHGSVLHCATYFPRSALNSDVLQMLIERGADINAVNSQGKNVVCSALANGNERSTIQLLLDAGGSLNGCRIHSSPLMCLIDGYGPLKASVVQMLLEADVDAHLPNAEGMTALQCAHRHRKYETKAVAMLLDSHNGMDLNTLVDDQENTLLHLAVYNEHCKLGVVKLLVQRGVKVDTVNIDGKTPLNTAVQNHFCLPGVIKFLLKNGAKVEANSIKIAAQKDSEISTIILKLLLAASDQITEVLFHSILKIALDKCYFHPYSEKAGFRFLARVYFLQVSDYCMPFLNLDHRHYQDTVSFRDMCVPELLKMKSKNVGRGRTLHDFLSSYPYKQAADQENMYDFDRLLEAVANDAFPLYFEIIAWKVGKRAMKEKLQKVRMSAPNPTNVLAEEIVLTYDVMLKISHFLEKEDLLKFILASLSNVDSSGSNVDASTVNKRKAEKS